MRNEHAQDMTEQGEQPDVRPVRPPAPPCWECGSTVVAWIDYGYPMEPPDQSQGPVDTGGCVIFAGMPDVRCRDCGFAWQLPQRPVFGHADDPDRGTIR